MGVNVDPGSFRDPSGFVYLKDGDLFRQVNKCYADDFSELSQSGLLKILLDQKMLVPHENVDLGNDHVNNVHCILKPEIVPFISYPYEWSFSQLKDAALLTLQIQKISLEHGMTLKDASAFNVQFVGGKPIFIDTLSFERYCVGEPWVAYSQFCRHFLAPLALMAYKDVFFNKLFRIFLDGIPLDIAVRLLPITAFLNLGIFIHLKVHAQTQKNWSNAKGLSSEKGNSLKSALPVSKQGMLGIIENLISTIKKMNWKPIGSEWADYYSKTNYVDSAFLQKQEVVKNIVNLIKPKVVWDVGSNDGSFSRIASKNGASVISFDIDPAAVEKNYLTCKLNNEINILPLLMDFTNPSPNIGWDNAERRTILQRGSADMVLALAIIHHLAIGNNLSFTMIAEFFSKICNHLVIEFVHKSDSQVQRMLTSRKDVFVDYTEDNFVFCFQKVFDIVSKEKITNADRVVFFMKKK